MAVALLILLIAVVGGRITPLFTKNALGIDVRPRGRVDALALLALTLGLAARTLDLPAPVVASGLGTAALLHAWRMRGWGSLAARSNPLLLVLHLGYLWLVLGLALKDE